MRISLYSLIIILGLSAVNKITAQSDTNSSNNARKTELFAMNIEEKMMNIVVSDSDTLANNKKIDTVSAVSGKSDFSPNAFWDIVITRQDNADIKIDGDLNEPVWNKLKRYGNFSEVSPGDNTKPEVETEVMMFYDDDNLYFGYICYDNDMTKIHKTFCERDKMFSDDFCGFFLDTYNEGRQAYELFVNPYGIQGDLMWNTPGNEDETFDMIWHSASKTYKDRWAVEIVIPFKSIRFPDNEIQKWQIHFLRIRPRENRNQYSLIPISRDDPSLFTKAIKLDGVKDIKGGKNIEVLPYAISTQSGVINDNSNANSEFINDEVKGNFGFNIKYGITSNITSDFAYNPDFSQVESDAGIISANNTFAFAYNEKRPFFLEGANIFSSPLFVVYTRAINNPQYAFKLTGKVGKTEFGYLTAYDKQSPFIIPFAEYSDFLLTDRKSLSNIFRVKQTLKDDSYLGFILTDRQVNKGGNQFLDVDGYNRAFGIDGKIRFLDNYSVDFQFMKYVTKEINYSKYDNPNTFDNGKHTSALDGEYFTGSQNYAILNRSARNWNFNLSYRDVSPESRRDNGYLGSNDFRELATWQGYLFYPDSKLFLRIQPQLYTYVRHNFDGRLREIFARPEIWVQLANQINLDIGFAAVNNEKFGGVYHEGVRRGYVNFNVNSFKEFTLGGFFEIGKYIIRSDAPSVGNGMTLSLWSTFKPISSVVMQNSYDYFELSKSYRGEKLYAGYILRNTTSYNFTKDITIRLISEFNSFSGGFYFNPLASYKPNPFTIFYFGFTNHYENLDVPDGVPKYALTDRQFFLKMQYLFRM